MAEQKKVAKTKRPTAQKRDIQNAKRRLENRSFKTRVRTAIRSFEKDVAEKNESGAKAQLGSIFSLLDKGVKKGIFKLNQASRMKGKFTNRV